jgi:hypothetical protein
MTPPQEPTRRNHCLSRLLATPWLPRAARRFVGAVLTLAVATVLAGVAPAPAHAADFVRGLEYRYEFQSTGNVLAPRHLVVQCPAGKQVVSGGADSYIAGDFRIELTQMEPYRVGDIYRFSVTAAPVATGPIGSNDTWALTAFAVCADPVPGWEITTAQTTRSTSSMQATAAVCPSGKRAIGAGARINFPLDREVGGVALQVVRASGTGDITRAQAHEPPYGYAYEWNVLAFAVCAYPPRGYQVVYGESDERASEPYKTARAACPLHRISPWTPLQRKRVLGMGGAVSNVAPGEVGLISVQPKDFPYDAEDRQYDVDAAAMEAPYTPQNWDFIVAQAICVS